MQKLTCGNGFYFNFDETKKFRLFFGSNAIGKTQASRALKKFLEDQGSDVLFFDSDIQSSMLIGNPKDENAFSICPNGQKITFESNEIRRLEDKMAFKDTAKKTFGSATGTAYAGLPAMTAGVKENLLPSNIASAIQTVPVEELRLLITPKSKNINNFPKLLDAIENDDNFFIPDEVNISTAKSQSVREVQEKIVSDKINICPVCSNGIDEARRLLIENEIKLGTVTDDEKESLLYYLSNVKCAKEFIDELIKDKKQISQIRKIIDEQLVLCLKNTFDADDIKKLDEHVIAREKLIKESDTYTLKNLSDAEKKEIVEEIKTTFNMPIDPDVEFDKGYISLKNMNPPFKDLSESEQDFFEILYFRHLITQKILKNAISIIMDDPFDSYDDANIFRSVTFLSQIIISCGKKLENCFIFSHSLHVITLFQKLHDQRLPFDVVWLDSELGGKEIRQFVSFSDLLYDFGCGNSDYGLPLYMMKHTSGPEPFLVEACLLRDHIEETKRLWPNLSKIGLRALKIRLDSLFRNISNSIDHPHSTMDLGILQKDFYDLYAPSCFVSLSGIASGDVFSKINFLDFSGFVVRNEKSVPLGNDDVLTLFTFKVLIALELRRIYEEKAKLLGLVSTGSIGSLVLELEKSPGKKASDLVSYYNSRKEILCCFEHSTSRNVPPVFVYRLSQLQLWFKELDDI
jgi:hypothetical protein